MDQSWPRQLGKSALRLAEDLSLYDSTNPPITGRNLLSQVPPVYEEDWNGPLEFISSYACHHNYVTKSDQTSLTEEEPLHGTGVVKVCAICSKCRWHLQLVVTRDSASNVSNDKAPDHLHYFVYKSGRQKSPWVDAEVTETGQTAETFHYECAEKSCNTFVSLRLMSPILSPQFTALLTDPDLIRQRAMEAFASQPDRLEGMALPLPITVLDNLRLYLNNALRFPDRSKPITQGNKRFMVSFGIKAEPCHELLEFLGFTHREADGAWEPPKIRNNSQPSYLDPTYIFLDDVTHELISLINQIPPTERRELQPVSLPEISEQFIERALGAMPQPPRKRRKESDGSQMASYYATMGLSSRDSAQTILDHYQILIQGASRSEKAYATRVLRAIASSRVGQDKLDIEARLHELNKLPTEPSPVDLAWKELGFDPPPPKNDKGQYGVIAKEVILAFYQRIDNSPEAEDYLRWSLSTIAGDMGSEKLKRISRLFLDRVPEAYAFLGNEIGDDTAVDFIGALCAAKLADCADDRVLIVKAMQTIALHRNLNILDFGIDTLPDDSFSSSFDATGPIAKMDVSGAYRLLEIENHSVDDASVHAAYIIAIGEPAKDKTKVKEAIDLIMYDRGSENLRSMISEHEPAPADHHPSEWPVGLANIGNTCYLNSLLQYLFSIKPFRDLALRIDDFGMDLDDEASIANRKVEGCPVLTKESVEFAVNVMRALGIHFDSMVKTPNTAYTPTKEFACLMLGGLKGPPSEINASPSYSLGEIDGAPVLGPAGPPTAISKEASEQSINEPTVTVTDQDAEMVDISSGDHQVTEFNTAPQSNGESENVSPSQPEQPNRAPPVPPRPAPAAQSKDSFLNVTDQQDVVEVMSGLLTQAQCAIKPDSLAPNGEQTDIIQKLFYGLTCRDIIKGPKPDSPHDDPWCILTVNGSDDIYGALDGLFGRDSVTLDGQVREQYDSIRKIPPILQIQVQRALFNTAENKNFKVDNHVQLHETIYMDRYMNSSDPTLLEKRYQSWDLKKDQDSLRGQRDELQNRMKGKQEGDLLTDTTRRMLEMTKDCINELGDDLGAGLPELVEGLQACGDEVREELKVCDAAIEYNKKELGRLFDDYRKVPYRLYAVFIHRGNAFSGHYWVYIYDPRQNIWRKYNDEQVTEVKNPDEIFSENLSKGGNTYLLSYVDEEQLVAMADPVHRKIDSDQMES